MILSKRELLNWWSKAAMLQNLPQLVLFIPRSEMQFETTTWDQNALRIWHWLPQCFLCNMRDTSKCIKEERWTQSDFNSAFLSLQAVKLSPQPSSLRKKALSLQAFNIFVPKYWISTTRRTEKKAFLGTLLITLVL